MNTQKNSKVYWSLLKISLNDKRVPFIPPLFYDNLLIIDFKEKTNFLIFYFLNNAPIALFLLMLIILLTNVYLQLHCQPEILEKSFKILIQTKPMDIKYPHAKNMW